jgi:hypothetical protein
MCNRLKVEGMASDWICRAAEVLVNEYEDRPDTPPKRRSQSAKDRFGAPLGTASHALGLACSTGGAQTRPSNDQHLGNVGQLASPRRSHMVRLIGAPKLVPAPFEDEVHDMGDFIMAHPEVLGDEVRVISRELEHGPDVRRLDFLVCDAGSNQPGLVELKKDFADEKVLLQTLRYADWLRSNPDTIRYQVSRQGWDIDPDEIEDNLNLYRCTAHLPCSCRACSVHSGDGI